MMASRSCGKNSNRDWDPMQEDFNNSNYDSQYPDDSSSDFVKLDHCRLYIRNIPKALNDEGLRAAFNKYGTLTEVFVCSDPSKRYGIVSFETPAEAKHAMMKLDRTEPLRLNISIAHQKKDRKDNSQSRNMGRSVSTRERESSGTTCKRSNRDRDETTSFTNRWRTNSNRKTEEMANGDNLVPIDDIPVDLDDDLTLAPIHPDLQLELERLQLEQLKLQQAQVACKQRMIIKQAERNRMVQAQPNSRCVLPDGKVILRSAPEINVEHRDADGSFSAGAGDSNKRECADCTPTRDWDPPASDDGCSTPSTCKVCTERTYEPQSVYKEKSDHTKYAKKDGSKKSDYTKTTDAVSRKSINSKTTDLTSKKSDYCKFEIKKSDTKKCLEQVRSKIYKHKSDETCELKYSDFYSDSEEEADETNRLIQLRNSDYMDVVDDQLKIVVALAGYPKSKMRLRQMETFQRCMTEVMDMQLKAGLLKRSPTFLDYYLNRGAIVCICKDFDTRDWMVRISPGLQERMCINLILLKSKLKRLCLAMLKIPSSCWPATAQDTFKLLQYFNPTLKTDQWKIYAQKTVDDIEITSFLIDRVSGEIIRGPTFKNVIDYNEMQFELTGYTEIYYECLLSDLEEDLSSMASRVKLLEEIKSENASPREQPVTESKVNIENEKREPTKQETAAIEKAVLESSLQKDVLKKLKDVKYISDKDEVINWSDETNFSDQENEKRTEMKKDVVVYVDEETIKMSSYSGVAVSEKTESIFESNDNLTMSRNSNLNIDTNRGIAYHRRTNYLHVENELKVAITLEGYPQDKLEGTHIRRLKHLFKEYLHKDMKNQRFANLIIPKFQDIYLSNGAVIYICDSLETKDYLTEILPKFVNSTGLKLTFRDIKNLVRYTRIVMRLPKEHAHVETLEILLKLQVIYPGLKPNCWKYYSDVAGKQKRQFGVDPESLDVIKSPDFEPTYQGDKIIFRIIDRQKRDVSFEEPTTTDTITEYSDSKRMREVLYKNMYVPIDPEIMNAPLTRIRTNHYSDVIADDLKLYVGPSSYPESRIDDSLFHSIKRTLENAVLDGLEKGELSDEQIPTFHDMYLFDGVIFIICQNMYSRYWVEDNLTNVNTVLHISLKATEFRGAVGIISMVVRTDKDMDEVISILQTQNPRLRTKFWRKISTVRTKTKLDTVLQIDKLSAQVMTSPGFNKFIDSNPIQYKLGHLQSLLKPKASLEELQKMHDTKKSNKTVKKSKSKVSMQGPKDKTFEQLMKELRKEYPCLKLDDWNVLAQHEKATHQVCDLEIDEVSAKIIEKEDFKLSMGDEKLFFYTGLLSQRSAVESHRSAEDSPAIDVVEPDSARTVGSADTNIIMPAETNQDLRKMILKIPMDILPDNKDDLNIIFDLLEDKNPGLNTELWTVFTDAPYPNNGKFTILIDRQSAAIIEGKKFEPTLKIPELQREGSRSCVACGAHADAFCARCGVTPYCSARCQRRDWQGRHSSVCHNLARMNAPLDVTDAAEIAPSIPAPAPLRRPRSPPREPAQWEDRDDSGSERGSKKCPPGHHSVLKTAQAQSGQRNQQGGNRNFNNRPNTNQFDIPNRQFDKSDRQFDKSDRQFDKSDRQFDKSDRFNRQDRQGLDGGRPPLRRPQVANDEDQRSGQSYSNRQQTTGGKTFPDRRGLQNRVQFTDEYQNDEDWDSQGSRNRQQNQKSSGSLLDRRRLQNGANFEHNYEESWDASKPEAKPMPQAKVEPKPNPVKSPEKETPIVRASRVEPASASTTQREAPPANQNVAKSPATNAKAPGSAADTTPTRKLVPKNCLIELMSQGDTVLLSVESLASDCHTKSTGFVCLSLHEKYSAEYEALCEDYAAACEANSAPYAPTPGEAFSYFNAEDGGWYRARCLSPTHCALLDASRVVSFTGARTARLPVECERAPEFTTLLQAAVQVGDNLKCVLVEKTASGWKVDLENVDGTRVGEGEVSRWLPAVQHPPAQHPPAPAAPTIPEVPRPDVTNSSSVLLVHVVECKEVFVRLHDAETQRAFDAVLHDAAMFGLSATPLSEPPTAGSYVLSKYTDGLHYRALVKRTSVTKNKYLLEYVEYGNSHINTLEKLYPCPDALRPAAARALTSRVALQVTSQQPLTKPAEEYLDKLKDDEVELVLTIPGGAKTAPSGAEVILTVASNKEHVNRKVQEMCTPDWVKLEQRGGDVLETEPIMYQQLQFLELPAAPCELTVTDVSPLMGGTLSVCPNMPDLHHKLAAITERMAKYCASELGREPYLPKTEELCIAQMPPYTQWFRAALAEQKPGEAMASVCYIDYGNMEQVPVTLLRKMLPEFMRGLPAIASTADIRDFPKNPTPAMLQRALDHLKIDEDGRGTIRVARWVNDGAGMYTIDTPELLAAMLNN